MNKDITIGPTTTLREWLIYWLEFYIKPVTKPSAYEHYADNCYKHIIPYLGHIQLAQITTPDIQKFFNLKAAAGNLKTGGPLSAKSIKNMRVVLNLAMKRAVADGHIPENPVPLTAIKHVRSKRVEAMTEEDQARLENYLFGQTDIYGSAELMAMHTGGRRGEVCALRWRHYDRAEGIIHIEDTVKRLPNYNTGPGEPKTKLVFSSVKSDSSDRILTLPAFLQELIERQWVLFLERFGCFPQPDDYIFYNVYGTVMDPDNLTHYHQKVLRELGLTHKKLHALRHTFAVRGIENGIDVSTMSGLLGHADVTTTTHFYVKPRDAAMKKAMQGIQPVTQALRKPDDSSITMKQYRNPNI